MGSIKPRRVPGRFVLATLASAVILASCTPAAPVAPSLNTIGDARTAEGDAVDVPFTIAHPDPAVVSVQAASDTTSLVPEAGLVVLGTGSDRTLRVAPASTGLGTARITLVAETAGGSDTTDFELEVTPAFGSAPQKLVPADGAIGDFFGARVAVGSEHALVWSAAETGGSVYPVDRVGDVWELAPRVTASDANAGDSFGFTMAVDGDRAVIGAFLDDEFGFDAGAAYVFERTGSGWVERVKLTASDAAAGDHFGQAVDIHGSMIALGAPVRAEGGAPAVGAVYVFEASGDVWTETDTILSGDPNPHQFGERLALDADRLVVGVTRDDDLGVGAGAAYVFRHTGSDWVEEDKLLAADGGPGLSFGAAVDVHEGVVVVGAPGDATKGAEAGAAYVFEEAAGVWSEAAKLLGSDGMPEHYFAESVAIHGVYVLVSAVGDDEAAADAGAAYLFKQVDGAWTELKKLIAPDGASGDYFAFRVALSADHALIGSDSDDDNGAESGSAYVFRR